MDLISLLFTLIIVGVILGLVYWALGQLPIPAPIKMVINVVLVLIIVIWLLSILTGHGHVPVIRVG